MYVDKETGEIMTGGRTFRNNTAEEKTVSITVKPGEQIGKTKPKKFSKNDFTMVFHSSNRELVRKQALSDDEKSLLFSLLIYLDYDQYAKDEKDMFFNVKRASELMSWGRNRTGRTLDSLCSKDKRLMGFTKIGREKYYMLNPHFIYRGDTSALGTAIKLFEQAAFDEEETTGN